MSELNALTKEGSNVADEDLIQRVVVAVRRLDYNNPDRDGVDPADLAADLQLRKDREIDLWHALKVAEERGQVKVFNWPSEMGMPEGISLP